VSSSETEGVRAAHLRHHGGEGLASCGMAGGGCVSFPFRRLGGLGLCGPRWWRACWARFKDVASRHAVLDVIIDRKSGAGFISALNEVLRSEGAPTIPEKASAEDIARHLASIDPGLALKALRHAEEHLKNEITMIIEEAKHAR
jgi:hypothetical protein